MQVGDITSETSEGIRFLATVNGLLREVILRPKAILLQWKEEYNTFPALMRIHYNIDEIAHPDLGDQDFLASVKSFMIKNFNYPWDGSFDYANAISDMNRIGVDYSDFTLDSRPLFCELNYTYSYPYMTINKEEYENEQTP